MTHINHKRYNDHPQGEDVLVGWGIGENMKSVNKTMEEFPITLTVEDVAEILRISRNKAYMLCRTKGFPAKRIVKRVVIPKSKFIVWLETSEYVQ